jgi:hypothetical protein
MLNPNQLGSLDSVHSLQVTVKNCISIYKWMVLKVTEHVNASDISYVLIHRPEQYKTSCK